MKNTLTLSEFAQEIERCEQEKQDYLVDTRSLRMETDDTITIQGEKEGQLKMLPNFHQQLATKLKIPKPYWDKMTEIKGLRSFNANQWLEETPENRLVRTLDGKARAYLSDTYKPIDNAPVMSAIMPSLVKYKDENNLKIIANSLTPHRMTFQVVFPQMEAEVRLGDPVQWGLTFTNSEVGLASWNIRAFIWRLTCLNGAIAESLLRKYHVGRKRTEDDYNIFASDTQKAEQDAMRLQIRDIVKDAVEGDTFSNYIDKLKVAAGDNIPKPLKTVENVTKRYGIAQEFNEAILNNMMEEGNPNRYGLVNGLTNLAKKIDDGDMQYDLENTGGKIIDLNEGEWKVLNAA